MNPKLAALLSCMAFALTACDAEEAHKPASVADPMQTFADLVRFVPPTGWSREAYANGDGADPVLAFEDLLDRISLRRFGAPGSAFATSASFLRGPAATTMGSPPEVAGTVTVAGRELTLYRRGFPIHLGDPHVRSGGPVTLGRAVFCVLPTDGDTFVVLSYERESPAPDLEGRPEKVWASFLKTVEIVRRPR